MYKDILYEADGPAAVVTLNRPGSLNAFTQLMLAEVRHALGPSRALDLLWMSKRVQGEEVYRFGLADRLCEDGESVAEAKAYIGELAASTAPMSLMMMKRQVYKHMNAELGPAMAQTNQWMDESLERSDFAEGVKSFMEKRAPNFAPLQAD